MQPTQPTPLDHLREASSKMVRTANDDFDLQISEERMLSWLLSETQECGSEEAFLQKLAIEHLKAKKGEQAIQAVRAFIGEQLVKLIQGKGEGNPWLDYLWNHIYPKHTFDDGTWQIAYWAQEALQAITPPEELLAVATEIQTPALENGRDVWEKSLHVATWSFLEALKPRLRDLGLQWFEEGLEVDPEALLGHEDYQSCEMAAVGEIKWF